MRLFWKASCCHLMPWRLWLSTSTDTPLTPNSLFGPCSRSFHTYWYDAFSVSRDCWEPDGENMSRMFSLLIALPLLYISVYSTYSSSKQIITWWRGWRSSLWTTEAWGPAKNEEGVLPLDTPAEAKQSQWTDASSSFIRTAWSRQVRQHGLVLRTALGENAALRRCFHSFPVTIIWRAQWGAAPPKSREELKGPAQKAVIHHTALPTCSGLHGCKDLLQSIQRSHMKDRNFDDIGYKWVMPHSVQSFLLCVPKSMFWDSKFSGILKIKLVWIQKF